MNKNKAEIITPLVAWADFDDDAQNILIRESGATFMPSFVVIIPKMQWNTQKTNEIKEWLKDQGAQFAHHVDLCCLLFEEETDAINCHLTWN